jgi:5-formyltetrahydrofolate cyclo-ligase
MKGRIRIRRAYDPADSEDGIRILVDRFWPEGLSRERMALDGWEKEIAPSEKLYRWFVSDPGEYDLFSARYRSELSGNPAAAAFLHRVETELDHGNVTLVHTAEDGQHCNAAVLEKWMEEHIRDVLEERKKKLRQEMRVLRETLPDSYMSAADDRIQQRILDSERYRNARHVFLYVSVRGEPSTGRILKQALEEGKNVYIPQCGSEGKMEAVRVRDLEHLAPGAFGIPEPREGLGTAETEDLDLILVPCLAASPDGRRLGRGMGYYDRFLAGRSENAVCLCYARMLREDIPVSDRDIRMPEVVSEEDAGV